MYPPTPTSDTMLTESFYTMIAAMLKGESGFPGNLYIAVGEGNRNWDTIPPDPGRTIRSLTREVARKKVDTGTIIYLNPNGSTSRNPTPHIRMAVDFGNGEAVAGLRECGLYGGDASDTARSGTLLAYYVHPVINKTALMTLQRAIRINLTPAEVVAGSLATRFLANVKTEELHDLNNTNPNCQISEMRVDYRHYFATIEQALALGYDRCAYCFGRNLSQR